MSSGFNYISCFQVFVEELENMIQNDKVTVSQLLKTSVQTENGTEKENIKVPNCLLLCTLLQASYFQDIIILSTS